MSSSRDFVSAPTTAACSSGCQRTLGGNRFEDAPAAVLELAQVAQPLLQLAELGIVQGAGGFLPVAGDEGHGGPGVEQIHGGLDLPRQDAELAGDLGGDAGLLGMRHAGLC